MTGQSRAALPFRPTAVLFDLDGTLVDSAPDIAAAVNELLRSEGLAPHSLPAVRGMIGHGLEKLDPFPAEAAGLRLELLRRRARADLRALEKSAFDEGALRRRPPRLQPLPVAPTRRGGRG